MDHDVRVANLRAEIRLAVLLHLRYVQGTRVNLALYADFFLVDVDLRSGVLSAQEIDVGHVALHSQERVDAGTG